ncbi:MAG: type II toxin-antitoxin system MqsA family antitoxin [Anaerolineae bacterium]
MTGEPESDRCYFCGGRLTSDLATLPFVVNSSVIVIKDVPAEVCTQCREAVLVSEVAEVVDRLLKQVERTGFEVSIIRYEHLTMEPA